MDGHWINLLYTLQSLRYNDYLPNRMSLILPPFLSLSPPSFAAIHLPIPISLLAIPPSLPPFSTQVQIKLQNVHPQVVTSLGFTWRGHVGIFQKVVLLNLLQRF